MQGRRTEVDYLNGYVSAQGRKVGVQGPFNDAVVKATQSHGVGTLRADPKHLAPLIGMRPT